MPEPNILQATGDGLSTAIYVAVLVMTPWMCVVSYMNEPPQRARQADGAGPQGRLQQLMDNAIGSPAGMMACSAYLSLYSIGMLVFDPEHLSLAKYNVHAQYGLLVGLVISVALGIFAFAERLRTRRRRS